jgi:hypothetical protein
MYQFTWRSLYNIQYVCMWNQGGGLRVPTKRSRDILQQAKGITLIIPLRSDGSRDDKVGEAGPVEQSSAEAKSLKTKGQGAVRLQSQVSNSQGSQTEGPVDQIKDFLTTHLIKKKESSSLLKHKRAKGTRQRKSITVKTKECLL